MRSLLFICSFLISCLTFAQDPKVQASVNRTSLSTNQTLQLTYTINTDDGQFTPPNFREHFRIYSGPNQSTNMSWINGRTSYTIQYSYILIPTKTGQVTIPPAVLKIDDKEYKSNSIVLNIQDGSQGTQGQTQEQVNNGPSESDIFIRTLISDREVYQGDQLLATYKLYTRLSLSSLEGVELPANAGFYTSEIELDRINRHSREVLNGIAYDVYTLKQTILVPQRSGELEIGALEADAIVQVRDPKPINTIFGPRYRYQNEAMSLKSRPIKVEVKPLPDPAPNSFNGAVGKYDMTVSIDKTELSANDAFNLIIEIKGEGNIALVEPVIPDFPTDFEVYDPKISTKVSNETKQLKGSKKWEYLIIPRFGGEFTIDAVQFSYFDVEKGGYVDDSSKKIDIKVAGSKNNREGTSFSEVERRNVKKVGDDIRYIKTDDMPLKSSVQPFYRSPWYYASILLLIGLSAGIIFVLKRQDEAMSDTVGMRRKKAAKLALKRLSEAQTALQANDNSTFYDKLNKGLYDYVADKFTIQKANLSKSTIRERLSAAGVHSDKIDELENLIGLCDMARYAPSAESDPSTMFERAKQLIVDLENQKA